LRFWLVIAGFLALVGLLAVGLRLDPREVPSPLIGKPAPGFALPRLDQPAKALSEKDLRGQVWLAPQMRRAGAIFYNRPTVTALRALAFRIAGRRDERKGGVASRGGRNWVGRRLVVGVAADDSAEPLIHAVNRIAIRNNAAWLAVHVIAGRDRRSPEQQERLEAALALARELGGETAVVSGRSVPEELIRVAQTQAVAQIIVGRSQRSAGTAT